MSHECFIVAIDGPAGAGKSTTSRMVAERLDLGYVDSGALYRCVGLAALEAGVDLDDDEQVAGVIANLRVDVRGQGRRFFVNGRDVTEDLRRPEVSQAASKTSACPSVREALLGLQRGAVAPPGAVVEGRDIGTVVFPDADLKIFLTADPAERVRRRTLELERTMGEVELAQVRGDMTERDRRDRTRALAPLKAAPDAVVVDTTDIDLDGVVGRILSEVKHRTGDK